MGEIESLRIEAIFRPLRTELKLKERFLEMKKIGSLRPIDIKYHRHIEIWEKIEKESRKPQIPQNLRNTIERFYRDYEKLLKDLTDFVEWLQEFLHEKMGRFFDAPFLNELTGIVVRSLLLEKNMDFKLIVMDTFEKLEREITREQLDEFSFQFRFIKGREYVTQEPGLEGLRKQMEILLAQIKPIIEQVEKIIEEDRIFDLEKSDRKRSKEERLSVGPESSMIEIGIFVFEKFLSPPERAEEGIRWLHFVRKDRRPSSPQDTKELKRIIEENKPESSVILYVNTIDFRDYVKATGEFPLDEGSPPQGTILSLKGGSEEEVLEYCKLISENTSQRSHNYEALAVKFAPELYYEDTQKPFESISPDDFQGLYWRAIESSVSWADVCIQYIAYFKQQRWVPSIFDKFSGKLPGQHMNDYVPIFIYVKNEKPVRVVFDICNYEAVGEINAPSVFLHPDKRPKFQVRYFYRGLLPLEKSEGMVPLGGIPIRLSQERLSHWWKGLTSEGAFDEKAKLIIRKKLEDPFKKITTFRDRSSRLGFLFHWIFRSVREQQMKSLSLDENAAVSDVEKQLGKTEYFSHEDIEAVCRSVDDILEDTKLPEYLSMRGIRKTDVPRLFLSYSSKDKAFVKNLAEKLLNEGFLVWYDDWEIHVGDSIVQKIDEGISSSDFLIIVLSKNSVNSVWVQRELNTVKENIEAKGALILPILLEQCEIPPLLSDKKYADFSRDPESAFQELLAAIEYYWERIKEDRKREILKYLENISEQELFDLVKGHLAGDRSEFFPFLDENTHRSTSLLEYYLLSTHNAFKERFEKTILRLINSSRESIDSLDYFAEILAIVERIGISDAYSRLLGLAMNENLKGQQGLGVDLHYQILKVLFGLDMDKNRENLEFIINRDIEDPRYAPLCFRRSWEMELKRGIDNLPILLKCYHEDPSINAKGALKEFFEELGPERFAEEFPKISQKLDVYFVDFIQLLDSIGIEPLFSDTEEKEKYDMMLRFPYKQGKLDFEKLIEDLCGEIPLRELMNRYMESLSAAILYFRDYFLFSISPFDYDLQMRAFSRIFLLSKEFKDRINEFNKEETEKIEEIIQALEREARQYERERFPFQIFYFHQFDELRSVLESPNYMGSQMETGFERFKLENHMILVGWSGTGKTRSLIEIAENSESDLIVVIKENIISIGVEMLHAIKYLGKCIVIWDDIEYSIDEFLEALPVFRELKDVKLIGAIQPIGYRKLEDNRYFKEMQFEKAYMKESVDKEMEELEKKARTLIAVQDYSEARSNLALIMEKNPKRKQSLQNEFGFLFDFTLSAEEDEKRWDENRELIEWRKNFWWILSDENNIDLTEMQSQEAEEVKVFEEESTGEEPVEIIDSELKPQEKGAALEKAVLKLFREFFIIGEEQEEVILEKLKIQGGGLQYGFDVGFECTVKENESIRCHIECKNLEGKIKLSHIAEKIIQTEDDYSGIDHWILISPRADPVGDLERKVTKWNNEKKYPFKIQIWSPETCVDEFFGLDPDIYDQFYKSRGDENHPSQWSQKKRNEVFEKWKRKLKPVIRLPREWEKYMRESFRMCIDDKEHDEFQALYQHYVPMRCMDERKNVLSLSLEDHVHEWLKDTRIPIMLLLGGFGDGKTAFTYILSRNLAKEFLENPSKGWIPVRFALKDYYSAENSRKFLRERLREFGADIDSWKELKGKHKLNRLVILDGFDEMTKELDPETITKNINSLVKCCDEFKGSKILITSRTYFFENQRNKERLLQKLRPYYLFYLAPIDRQTNIRHLEKHATTPDEKRKLKNMCKLHDPIGLASKPLFLHMVKETLSELPEEDLDEITLYNTYIKKSLYRKIENLEYDRAILTPDEIYSNIVDMMEEIALRIQELGENYFSLEEYKNTSKQTFAEILWKISNPEKDAAERVRIRTLLKQVKTKKDTPKQALDFCHRSMREYFVAKRLCRLLRENREKAKEFLTEFLLNNEILHFTAKLMGRNSSREYKCNLLYLIETTKGSNQSKYLGGNAATLLYRLKGELPGNDWSGLNLDYADLSRADLSNKNFRYTSLRFARLDNVNFEGADFRNCDLTGVRIEETAPVLAVTVPPIGDRIIAAYGDNTIRDWNIAQQSNYETQIICENTDGSINQLETHFGSDLCAITNEEVIFYDFGDQKELLQRARFRKKPKYGYVVAKKDILLLVSDEENQMSKVLAVDLQQREIICVLDLKKITLCENLDRQTFALPEGKTLLNIRRTETSNTETTISLPAHEVTSLCVRYCDESDKYLLACGQRNGKVLVWQIDLSTDEWQHELVLENRVHEGLVSSLAFLDDSTIASGGVDRKISILRFGPGWGGIEGIEESDLQLIARCKGMKIDGIKRDIEQEMLRKLILKVEEITYHGNE